MGYSVVTVLGMIAQMERRLIKERQRASSGLKAESRYIGGQQRIDRTAMLARSVAGESVAAIATALAGLNVSTIRRMEASGGGPIAGRAANVHAVQHCLQTAGVDFIPAGGGGGPGVHRSAGVRS